MSLFTPKPCPYCGERTFGFYRKTRMNPWFGYHCTACQGLVTTPWAVPFIKAALPFIPFIWFVSQGEKTEANLLIAIGSMVAIALVAALVDFHFTPLKRKANLP